MREAEDMQGNDPANSRKEILRIKKDDKNYAENGYIYRGWIQKAGNTEKHYKCPIIEREIQNRTGKISLKGASPV